VKKSEYEIILNSIAEGVFVVNLDRAIVYINDAAKKLVGVEENDVIGKRCYEVFKSSVCEKQCLLKRLIKEGKSIFDEEVEITDLFGEKIDVLVSAVPITDKSGEIVGAVETIRDISIVKELDKEIREKYTFQDIVSKNKRILEIFKILPDIAKSDSTVLISGENGTGKELFANAIHNLSYRKDKPFIKINCGALPDNLLESELFGYKKGAFTGAVKDKPGRVETAEGGTIFLDEIGDLSPAFQVKLLRFLQEREYTPLGCNKTFKADVRVLSATNKDLVKMIEEGQFRQDLYFRIKVVEINLPPLRERKGDIPLLVKHLLSKFNRTKGKRISKLSDKAMELLMRYDYPGNIRELENIIEYSFVICKDIITPQCLPSYLNKKYSRTTDGFSTLNLKIVEEELIEKALKLCHGNKSKAAKMLGISRVSLWKKLKNKQ